MIQGSSKVQVQPGSSQENME